MQPSKIAYSCPKLFVAVFKAETNWIYSSMIIVNGILYLIRVVQYFLIYSIFYHQNLPLLISYEKYRNYRKYDIFFTFRFTENMIFPSTAENQENIFTLSVFTKMLFFMQCNTMAATFFFIYNSHIWFNQFCFSALRTFYLYFSIWEVVFQFFANFVDQTVVSFLYDIVVHHTS